MLRPKNRRVNTKPSWKFFVKAGTCLAHRKSVDLHGNARCFKALPKQGTHASPHRHQAAAGSRPDALKAAVLRKLKLPASALKSFAVFKRGHDARNKNAIAYIYTVDVELADGIQPPKDARPTPDMEYRPVATAPAAFQRPLVIGAGPCGTVRGLILAQSGFRPIILERGKVVRERTKDTWGLWRKSVLNPESNVQFGEGGAGTFSDGKLYSQIKDPRYLGRKVLREFVHAGAPEEILTEAHPHIGTFRLVTMVEAMRATIEDLGGEYRFQAKVVNLLLDADHKTRGVRLESGEEIESRHVVLALGHSARDTFQMLHDRGVDIEAKPFSIGFRIEHPQGMIDKARFGGSIPQLGAADYKLVHHAGNGRDVYSFCMCPGGTVVAARQRAGPRRHQRHEPVFPQRAQRQCRHRGRHHA